VLKATVKHSDKIYYAALPIIYTKYRETTPQPKSHLKLKYGTGFTEVTYNANGESPIYRGS
jgi:hypothetical protein